MVQKFKDFIAENNQQNMDEYIDFSKTNLEYDFDVLNKELFNNELEKVPLSWMKSKRKLGEMRSFKFKGSEQYFNINIFISTFYNLTRQQYLDVLAHEMIHVYLAQKGIKDNGHHGYKFKKMMNDINKKYDAYNIKPSENAAFYSVGNNTNIPERGVILLHVNDERYDIIVTQPNLINDRVALDEFVENFRKIAATNVNFLRDKKIMLSAYKVQIPAIAQFKAIRKFSFRSLSIFSFDEPTLITQIKGNKKILETQIK